MRSVDNAITCFGLCFHRFYCSEQTCTILDLICTFPRVLRCLESRKEREREQCEQSVAFPFPRSSALFPSHSALRSLWSNKISLGEKTRHPRLRFRSVFIRVECTYELRTCSRVGKRTIVFYLEKSRGRDLFLR